MERAGGGRFPTVGGNVQQGAADRVAGDVDRAIGGRPRRKSRRAGHDGARRHELGCGDAEDAGRVMGLSAALTGMGCHAILGSSTFGDHEEVFGGARTA